MDQEKEGSIPNFPSMEDKSRVKSRSSLELQNKGAYDGGLMVWKSRIQWAKQSLPQAGPVPELGGAGGWMEPQAGGAPGAAAWSKMLPSTALGSGPATSHPRKSAGVQQRCQQLHPSAFRKGFSKEDGQQINSKAAIHEESLSAFSLILSKFQTVKKTRLWPMMKT